MAAAYLWAIANIDGKGSMPFTNLLGRPVLSEGGKMHIADHKYKAGVYTPLDNLLNGWWFGITECLPRSVHPNLLTAAGSFPIAMCYWAAWYASSDMTSAPPRWLCFAMAFSLFVYQTLDAVDGKQARRINQSTPLGQLFDHGCDCMACLSHHSMACCIWMPGAHSWTLWGLAVLQTGFFLAQWQEHYTGVLHTCIGPVGVTESQYAVIGLTLFGGIVGPDRLEALGARGIFGEGSMPFGHCFVLLWVIFNIVLMSICFYMTMSHKSSLAHPAAGQWSAPAILRHHEALHRPKALLDLAPLVFLNFVFLFGWHSDIVTTMPRVLCLSAGLLFFYLTAQMIVFSMAVMPFSANQPMLLPFAALALASRCAYLPFEMVIVKFTLVAHTVVIFIYVLMWLTTVINEIKAHLGIHIFTVSEPTKNH